MNVHKQDFRVTTSISAQDSRKKKETSWVENVKQFIKDWFWPTLTGGHIKFDFQQKHDEMMQNHFKDDPFKSCSRIRGFLVHDLIKDIELTSNLREKQHYEMSGEEEGHSHEYRGLEWLKKKGYVTKNFVPHSKRDKKQFEKKRLEKHPHFPIQSVTAIREYLGEKVGFAFAWRAAWLSWGLTIPAIAG